MYIASNIESDYRWSSVSVSLSDKTFSTLRPMVLHVHAIEKDGLLLGVSVIRVSQYMRDVIMHTAIDSLLEQNAAK